MIKLVTTAPPQAPSLPLLAKMTLIPFKRTLVYDGIISGAPPCAPPANLAETVRLFFNNYIT